MKHPQKGEVRKPTKTISGITPVAVMLPPRRCEHGECLYCPNLDVPQSYTPKSPVVLRAKKLDYEPYEQVRARLKAFEIMNHPVEKIEIIIMGGTFLEYPENFQRDFVKGIYDGLNGKKSGSLNWAIKFNERAKHRCVALCVETRPDVCVDYIPLMREFGVTRVELGVQIIDDKIYEMINRGHKVSDVIEATRELKNTGFKVGYHIMPGLPSSSPAKDLKLFKKIFSDSNFRPDQLKIYPCQVMPGSDLEKLYWEKKYVPYSKDIIKKLLIKMFQVVPRYCRVMRVMREIPPEYLVVGTLRIDLRKEVEEYLRKKKKKLREIRYREIGFNQTSLRSFDELKLKVTKYKASKGDEYFLEIVNKDNILFGLLRLRIFNASNRTSSRLSAGALARDLLSKKILEEGETIESKKNEKFAIVRELHVYGKSLNLGEAGKESQHIGLGKWLMNEAEKIVQKKKISKVSVISGIGVREYYRKLDYKLEGSYMVKNLFL